MRKLVAIFTCFSAIACGTIMPRPGSPGQPDEKFGWSAYSTPIERQECGYCFIYATVGLLAIQYQIDHNLPYYNLDLDELMVAHERMADCGSGGDPRSVLDWLITFGVPETTGDQCKRYKFKRWKTWDTRGLEQALANGPVVAVTGGWDHLRLDSDGIYRCYPDENPQGHSVIIVGISENGNAIVKNSHGESGLIEVAFDADCHIDFLLQIDPGSTYVDSSSCIPN